jgi:hypothetical protein
MSIVTQVTTTDRNAQAAYTEYHRQRTEAATYAHQVKQAEARQRRFERMIEKSMAADPDFDFSTGLLLAA